MIDTDVGGNPNRRPKTESDVLSIVRRQLDNAIGAVGSDAIYDTTGALDAYHGRPYGTEQEGSSDVVMRDMLEVVEWMMASFLRIFASGDRVVRFLPFGPEDEAQADQETDYVNHVLLQDNAGWTLLDRWMRSALIERNAYVKASWKEHRRSRVTRYDELTDAQLAMVLAGEPGRPTPYDVVDVLAAETVMVVDPMTGLEMALHNVEVRETRIEGRVEVVGVPREDMRISKDTDGLCLDDTTLVAHVRDVTRTELIEMGLDEDVAYSLPSDRKADKTRQNITYARQVERGSQRSEFHSTDETTELIEIAECYIRIDEDGDGLAELRKIIYAGDRILVDEEVEEQPFVALSPMPQPHTHVGFGVGDLVMDLQRINSELWRGMLDNIALTNNPETVVVEDDVNIDDFLTSFAGKIKRVANMDSVRERVVPFAAAASMPLLELTAALKESRTGVTRQSMGVDAEMLSKSTLGAFSLGLAQGNQRIETIARTFAETGYTWLAYKIRGLVTRHQDRPRMVRLRGEYVEIDPRTWCDRYDTIAQVGIGTGGQAQALAQLAQLAERQEAHLQQGSPLVEWSNLYATYERMLEIMGYKDATKFFRDPRTPEFQAEMAAKAEAASAQVQREDQAMAATLSVQQAEIERKRLADQESSVIDLYRLRQDAEKEANRSAEKRTEIEQQYQADVPGALT